MKKKTFLAITVLMAAVTISACQSTYRRGATNGIPEEPALVENQINSGVVIVCITNTGEPDDDNAHNQKLESAAQLIQSVTGGTVYDGGVEGKLPDDYGTVFLGLSRQSDEFSEIVEVFLQKNDFRDKTIIPFLVTDEEHAAEFLNQLYVAEPESEFLDGFFIDEGDNINLNSELELWLSELGYNQ